PGSGEGVADDAGSPLRERRYGRLGPGGAGAGAGTTRRPWMRRATKLAAAAASRSIAIPARTSSGSGTEPAFFGPSQSIHRERKPFGGEPPPPLEPLPNACGSSRLPWPVLVDGLWLRAASLSRLSRIAACMARWISSDASA